MAARKARAGKRVENSTKSIPASEKRERSTATDLPEAMRRMYANSRKRKPEEDPNSVKNVQARRAREDERMTEAREARIRLEAEAANPRATPDVVVSAKQTERAAWEEQERIDIGKRAAKGQTPFTPPSSPEDKGFIPEPAHPEKPGPRGSAPRSPGTPEGPQGEDVIYVTDDIDEDGTPKVSQGFVSPTPEWDGESNRDYNELFAKMKREWKVGEAEPVQLADEADEPINSHSPEGAELDSIKLGRPVRFVPNDAWLDPVNNDPKNIPE